MITSIGAYAPVVVKCKGSEKMKIVDKYELAKCPKGTMFYEYTPCMIKNGPYILDSNTFYSYWDGKPMFNGVFVCEPDLSELYENEDINNAKANWFSVDIDSNDYTDEDLFIVLNKKEALDLIETMKDMVINE